MTDEKFEVKCCHKYLISFDLILDGASWLSITGEHSKCMCHVYGMCGRVSRIIKSLDRVYKLQELKRHCNKLGACPGEKNRKREVERKKKTFNF